ncbi:SycD/LcrH family type III secretion system chaperone [Succinivibrio sp.]|jgi:type III secretion system low calcium response chaperone LcrH/SycD|uniref:SycD/LcrH family type III secretion system chaperone n=1 Tax=Succinivibrio sp. TaxID=2053619 RepID=UPI0025D27EB1|nr:SycD/LcrH family type III secretion system chaperone [uncultured Succinivibrio sp.]
MAVDIDNADELNFLFESNEQKEAVLSAYRLIEKGSSLGDLVGLDSDKLEVMYAYAYNLYSSGQYADSEKIFRALVVYDGSITKYWVGLAACRENQKAFQEAAELYAMGATMGGLQDPEPMYYSALCRLKADQKENAIAALEFIDLMGKGNSPHDLQIKAKAKALLETLKNVEKNE